MIVRIAIIFLIFFAGCKDASNEIPPGIIARDSMVNIMADIHIAESRLIKAGGMVKQKEVKSAYLQQVLSNAGTDTARFFKSFDYYSAQPAKFAEMYEDVVVVISKRQAEKRNDK